VAIALTISLASPASARPITAAQPNVPLHLLHDLGSQPAIWNDAGRARFTVADTADAASRLGTVLAVFAPGVVPADHDLGANSALAPLLAYGLAVPNSMPRGLADALRRVPANSPLTALAVGAGTPGTIGLPGGEASTVGTPGSSSESGCPDPDNCEYIWLSIELAGGGFRCKVPTVFGICPPGGAELPELRFATNQDEHIIRDDGGVDTLTLSTIHFKDDHGDDWSRNFVTTVSNFDQANSGAYYFGSSSGTWSPMHIAISLPPISADPTARVTSDFCATDTVRKGTLSSSRLDGFQLDWDVLLGVGTGSAFTAGIGYCGVA
jgi:hypothetical protein